MTGDEWGRHQRDHPYKRAVMNYLDELSPLAERMGNVNTITRLADGRLRGDNTDHFGFQCLVEELGVEVTGKKVLVLGATGGAGTTASMVLGDTGAVVVRGPHERGQLRQYPQQSDAAPARQLYACRHVPPLPRRALHARRAPMRSRALSTLSTTPARTGLMLEAERRGIPRWSAYACWPRLHKPSSATPAKSPRVSAS